MTNPYLITGPALISFSDGGCDMDCPRDYEGWGKSGDWPVQEGGA